MSSTITPGATLSGTIGRLVLARNDVEAPNPSQVVIRLCIGVAIHDAAGQAPAGATIEPLKSEWTVNGQTWTREDLAALEIGFAGGT